MSGLGVRDGVVAESGGDGRRTRARRREPTTRLARSRSWPGAAVRRPGPDPRPRRWPVRSPRLRSGPSANRSWTGTLARVVRNLIGPGSSRHRTGEAVDPDSGDGGAGGREPVGGRGVVDDREASGDHNMADCRPGRRPGGGPTVPAEDGGPPQNAEVVLIRGAGSDRLGPGVKLGGLDAPRRRGLEERQIYLDGLTHSRRRQLTVGDHELVERDTQKAPAWIGGRRVGVRCRGDRVGDLQGPPVAAGLDLLRRISPARPAEDRLICLSEFEVFEPGFPGAIGGGYPDEYAGAHVHRELDGSESVSAAGAVDSRCGTAGSAAAPDRLGHGSRPLRTGCVGTPNPSGPRPVCLLTASPACRAHPHSDAKSP